MTVDMTMILGGKVLPNPTNFIRTPQPNESDTITLGGTLYTDFMNFRRSWTVSWDYLTREQFQVIYDLWRTQYTNHIYYPLQFDAESLYVPVKIVISSQKLKFNGSLVKDFSLELREQYAIS